MNTIRICALLALLLTTAWAATDLKLETGAAFFIAFGGLVAAEIEYLKRVRTEAAATNASGENRVLLDDNAALKAQLNTPKKPMKLSEKQEKILTCLWNGSYDAPDIGRMTTMTEAEATYHLGVLEEARLVHIPIVVNGKGTANITQEGREHVYNRNAPKSVEVVFPDGETEGGVDQLILTLIRQNGEETERNLPGAIGHNLSTTNRYITFAEKETLVMRNQVRMKDGVKITQFGIRYAESKNLK